MHTRRATTIAATLAALTILTGCSTNLDPAAIGGDTIRDLGNTATRAGTSENTRWKIGCGTINAAVTGKHAQRTVQTNTLRTLINAVDISPTQKRWAKTGVTLLSYDDPTRAPKPIRDAVTAPCTKAGHPIKALQRGPAPSGVR